MLLLCDRLIANAKGPLSTLKHWTVVVLLACMWQKREDLGQTEDLLSFGFFCCCLFAGNGNGLSLFSLSCCSVWNVPFFLSAEPRTERRTDGKRSEWMRDCCFRMRIIDYSCCKHHFAAGCRCFFCSGFSQRRKAQNEEEEEGEKEALDMMMQKI